MKLSALLDSWGGEGPVAIGLHRELFDVEVVAHFTINGEPQSKSRARVTMKNGKVSAYTPRQTELAEGVIAWKYRAAGGRGPDSTRTFGVFAAFFCGTRQRRDVDNMLKLILDGLNKIAWQDDSQVTEVSAKLKRGLGKDEARTEVVIYETVSRFNGGLSATKQCDRCRKEFRVYASTSDTRYCSRTCAHEGRRLYKPTDCPTCGALVKQTANAGRTYCSAECRRQQKQVEIACAECGTVFTKPLSWAKRAKYCGVACQAAAAKRRRVKVSKGTCIDCGGGVSRREYKRCKACSLEAARKL